MASTRKPRILTTQEGIRYVPDADMRGSDRPKLSLRKLYPANPEVFGRSRRRNPSITLQLDDEVTAWLESLGKRASTRANAILRRAMKESRPVKKSRAVKKSA